MKLSLLLRSRRIIRIYSLAFQDTDNISRNVADIIPFRKPKLSEKHQGNTLCRNGFHKWAIDKTGVFDVKQGKLVTASRCSRCGAVKNRLT